MGSEAVEKRGLAGWSWIGQKMREGGGCGVPVCSGQPGSFSEIEDTGREDCFCGTGKDADKMIGLVWEMFIP